ncbi:MAG: NADH-quinone oxidoreductase subunit N [Anaerolineae bacterium]
METLRLLTPEVSITIVAFLIITLDAAWNDQRKSTRYLPWLALGGALFTLAMIFYVWTFAAEPRYSFLAATDANRQVPMLAVDYMALFFKLIAVMTMILVGLASGEYLQKHTPFRGEFYGLTLFATLSIMLLVGATNLIMIYLALEFLSISSYILTGYLRRDARSIEAALKYFLYGALASGVMLYGFSLMYGATGSVDLATIAASLSTAHTGLVVASVILMLAGFGFKIALVPFHQWSPDAYEGAPTPITAFLSVGPKAAGLAVLIRVMVVALPEFSLNWVPIMSFIAVVTMTVGNLVALWQTNMKRMLAYSSIAQAGYMLVGLAAWTATPRSDAFFLGGVDAIMLFLLAYLFTNLGVFTIAIIMENQLGTSNISDYAGLVRRSPYLSVALLVFFLSLIGIPPTGGFMGKLFVFGAAVNQGLLIVVLFGVINSAISVYYYFGVVRQIFFESAEDESPIRINPAMNAVVALTLVMTLLMALYGQPFIQFASDSAQILAANF